MSIVTDPTVLRPALGKSGHHPLTIRAPWYVCERGGFDRFDPRALPPAIQKYDTSDFVGRLVADPRDSLQFDEDADLWSYAVPIPVANRGAGRLRLATHEFLRPGPCKLYQPSHDRFYAVVAELFCDAPGLPRPAPGDTVQLGLVLRRRQLTSTVSERELRRMGRDLRNELLAAAGKPTPRAVDGLRRNLVQEQTQAWMLDGLGGRGWVTVDQNGRPVAEAAVGLTEQVLPMWRLPPTADACPAARTRSLWFGLVPTSSADHESPFDAELHLPVSPGAPRLDDRTVYEIRCRAIRPPERGREHCPPEMFWSEPTAPFKLAAFFDPEGTRNHTASVTMPDLRAVAARAGQPPGPGGLAITTPTGSGLSFDPDNGTPSNGSVGGAAPRVCTFALELFMIVAFFVFSLFLPVVVFLFQLWWLLLLRFCLPPATEAMALLSAHFAAGGTLATLPDTAPLPPPGQQRTADRSDFDELLGAAGVTKRLAAAGSGFDPAIAPHLLRAVDPAGRILPGRLHPESRPPDPLCRPGGTLI